MGIKTITWLPFFLLFLLGVCILPFSAHCTEKYAGMYFAYYNENNEMHILFETDTGVDNDYNHRRLHFEYGTDGCSEPNWSYDYEDYNFWPDQYGHKDYPGIPGMKNRRLWKMKATALIPGCFYAVRFRYRDTDPGTWKEDWGHFYAPPKIGVENNPTLQFYAYGDCKVVDDANKRDVNGLAGGIMDHVGKKTFVLHVGDRVLSAGSPIGKYYYHYQDEGKYLHTNDHWFDFFFNLDNVHELLRHIPMFPTLGNHDFEVMGEGDCVEYYYYGNPATAIGCVGSNTYNYRHYFPGYRQGEGLEDQYYETKYGPAVIWTLTSYPMVDNCYCSDTNDNYRPKSDGGTGQYDWLESSLQYYGSFGQPPRWKIVQMHAPLYSPDSCANQEDGRTYLQPLFEDYGVDIVLSGHEHYYARKTVNGIPYVITGGGGATLSLSGDSECRTNPQCKGFDKVENMVHFLFFKVAGDIMSVDVLKMNEESIDTFTVDRRPKADFDATGASGSLDVSFTDKSTGHVYGCQWDFDGDGVTDSTERNPSHTYAEAGSYDVTLKAVSYWGTSSKYTRTIKVPAGDDTHSLPSCTRNWTDHMSVPGWFGSNNQGGGAAVADVDGNGVPDLLVFHIDHGSDANHGYYRIGWNMGRDGTISSWTDPTQVPGWFGGTNQGGGAAVADVDGNGMPDLLVFHIDHGSDANHGYYRIGWNMGSDGTISSWTDPVKIPGWFGTDSGGGGLAAADMDGNGTVDLIAFHVDHPHGDNKGYYRIGWDMGSDGTVLSWTDPMHVGDYFSQKKGSEGGGIAAMDIDHNGTPDLVAFDIEHDVGSNTGLYLVGLNPDKEGKIESWTNLRPIPGWWGSDNHYGGVTLADIDADGLPEMIAFHIDHHLNKNQGFYRVGWNVQADGDTCATCTDSGTISRPRHR